MITHVVVTRSLPHRHSKVYGHKRIFAPAVPACAPTGSPVTKSDKVTNAYRVSTILSRSLVVQGDSLSLCARLRAILFLYC